MTMVLLRVGIDWGSCRIQGPLFADGSFEFILISDSSGYGNRMYGTTAGRKGTSFVSYFPVSRQKAMHGQAMHLDPEFETFTYGDPTAPKAGLRKDMLVFYAGLQGWDHDSRQDFT
ncbi:MAG: hypothetical protein NVSMB6_24050 [Burkholderiaceae bacterium]